jgi:hypothetical protein
MSAVIARTGAHRVVVASAAALALAGVATSCTTTLKPVDPRAVARTMMVSYGWTSEAQFDCLDSLWNRESGWQWNATNPYSGAYGIPQSLPASKMAAAGADWRTNATTQIRWGLDYIQGRYGSPCGAWAHSQATGWYARVN